MLSSYTPDDNTITGTTTVHRDQKYCMLVEKHATRHKTAIAPIRWYQDVNTDTVIEIVTRYI